MPPRTSAPLVAHPRQRQSFIARANKRRSFTEKVADTTTAFSGSFSFLTVNILFFSSWIVVNLGFVPDVAPFDPYPFNFLTMVVSLEAIILSVLVLISQNREAKTADLREEVDFQVNTTAEREITLVLQMLVLLLRKQKIRIDHHPDVQESLKPLDLEKIERQISRQLETDEELFSSLSSFAKKL